MSFQPNAEHLSQVLQLLQQASSPQPDVVRMVWQRFEEFSQRNDFNTYVAHILGDTTQPETTRQWAAIVLKNGVKTNYANGIKPMVAYIQQQVLGCIGDPDKGIRDAVANCTSMLAREGDAASLKAMLEQLCNSLDPVQETKALGASRALSNICEDCAEEMLVGDASPAAALLPHMLSTAAQHPIEKIREQMLWATVNLFTGAQELTALEVLEDLPASVTQHIPTLLQTAMRLAMGPPETQQAVCRSLVFIAEHSLAVMQPHLKDTIHYVLAIQRQYTTTRPHLALEACDFWTVVIDELYDQQVFKERVPELIDLLFDGLVFGELEMNLALSTDDDIGVSDREDSINPNWKGKKKEGAAHGEDEDAEDDEDDDDDDDTHDNSWTLRKCCGSTLDAMALCYGRGISNEGRPPLPEVFMQPFMANITRRLSPDGPWLTRESAVLALGAAAEGCAESLQSSLGGIVQGLTVNASGPHPPPIQDSNPLMRYIACWTLGRYATIATSDEAKAHILSCLLPMFSDRSKKVVGSVAQAVSTVLEHYSGDFTEEQVHGMLRAIATAFATCQSVNLKLLFATLVTLTEVCGSSLNTPATVALIMPPLTHRWEKLSDEDPRLPALMGCLTAVATALGPGFQPWVQGCFERALRVVHMHTQFRIQSDYDSDEEFIVSSLDLIGGLLDGLGSAIEPLVGGSPMLMDLLHANLRDPASKVRQSVLALIGDITQWAFPHLRSHLPRLLPLFSPCFEPAYTSVCNNAVWALGGIAMKLGQDFRDLPPARDAVAIEFQKHLVRLINLPSDRRNSGLLENCAIALGRLAVVCPDLVAPDMEQFLKPFCMHLRQVNDRAEKEDALAGLARLIRVNPSGCFNSLAFICNAITSVEGDLPPSLKQEYSTLLNGFKSHIGDGWNTYYAQFPANLRQRLAQMFGLN